MVNRMEEKTAFNEEGLPITPEGYIYPSNFDPNSAYYELAGALSAITDTVYDNSLSHCDGHFSNLSNIAYYAGEIAELFTGVNSHIKIGWETVESFSMKIQDQLNALIENFAKELRAFIESGKTNEQTILNAVNDANSQAEEILKQLGL